MASCLEMNIAMALPTQREWEPTLSILKPAQSFGLSLTAAFTSRKMSVLWTCCQGRVVASRKVHMRVSGVVPLLTMSWTLAMMAQTGQHWLPFVKAWCDSILPHLPFF